MKTTTANPHTYNYSRLLAAMQASGEVDNISLNPCLPIITSRSMRWKGVYLLFEVNQMPVAWFVALCTGNEWFSLPHYNNGSFWFYKAAFNNWLQQIHADMAMDENAFFNSFIACDKWFATGKKEDRLLLISLDKEDIQQHGYKPASKLQLKLRAYHILGKHFLSHKTDSQLLLQPTAAAQFGVFGAGVRRKIRKAERNQIVIESGGIELLQGFYKVYRRNIHRLGSFGLPESFFAHLLKQYVHGGAKVFIAAYKGDVIGSAVLLTWLDYAENPWFATLRSHNSLYVSYLLHWAMIKESLHAGCRVYSFGYSTTGGGVHHYKQQWGTINRTIYLNSTRPVVDLLQKKQYLRAIIRKLPLSVTRCFDGFIATRYY